MFPKPLLGLMFRGDQLFTSQVILAAIRHESPRSASADGAIFFFCFTGTSILGTFAVLVFSDPEAVDTEGAGRGEPSKASNWLQTVTGFYSLCKQKVE